ncbi:MAG: hypothetical protein P8189_18670 [Anaerolineae bacterium]|jgi:hypothetical protein
MYTMLLARDADERAVLSPVLQLAGLVTTTAVRLERAMESWLERPVEYSRPTVGGLIWEHVASEYVFLETMAVDVRVRLPRLALTGETLHLR